MGTLQAPRPLRDAPRRVRQHVHVRAPEVGRRAPPGAQGAQGLARRGPRASSSCRPATPSRPRPPAPARQPDKAADAAAPSEAPRRQGDRASPVTRKERLFAAPAPPEGLRGRRRGAAPRLAGAGFTTFKAYFTEDFRPRTARTSSSRSSRSGSRVIAGTILGRIGRTSQAKAPHLLFEIRPAGRGAPRIDPKPILDGWKLLESTAIYRAEGKNPFFGPDAKTPSDRPDPADEQGRAAAPRPRRTRASRSTTAARRDIKAGRDRPPRARHARVPRRHRPAARR